MFETAKIKGWAVEGVYGGFTSGETKKGCVEDLGFFADVRRKLLSRFRHTGRKITLCIRVDLN